jgi:hypothetical protein
LLGRVSPSEIAARTFHSWLTFFRSTMVLSTPVTISPDQEFSDSAGALEGRPVVLVVEDEVLVRIVQVDESG